VAQGTKIGLKLGTGFIGGFKLGLPEK